MQRSRRDAQKTEKEGCREEQSDNSHQHYWETMHDICGPYPGHIQMPNRIHYDTGDSGEAANLLPYPFSDSSLLCFTTGWIRYHLRRINGLPHRAISPRGDLVSYIAQKCCYVTMSLFPARWSQHPLVCMRERQRFFSPGWRPGILRVRNLQIDGFCSKEY